MNYPTPTVRLQAVMGTDLTPVNAARASMGKASQVMTDADRGLLKFLANPTRPGEPEEEPHTSPFRHAVLRFEIDSALKGRLQWEGVENQAGMVFWPPLRDMASWADAPRDGRRWRWTASLAAVVRWIEDTEGTDLDNATQIVRWNASNRFPASIEALTGYQAVKLAAVPGDYGLTISNIGESLAPQDSVIPCLDKGHIRLVDYLPAETPNEAVLQFEIKAPLMVRSWWFKYQRHGDHSPQGWAQVPWAEEGTGNGDDGGFEDPLYARNEMSRRYVTGDPEFYTPTVWHKAPASKKQGSGKALSDWDSGVQSARRYAIELQGVNYYQLANAEGVAPEETRLYLPSYGLYTSWYWTTSFRGFEHFLKERTHPAAQGAIREYAEAARKLVEPIFGGWLP